MKSVKEVSAKNIADIELYKRVVCTLNELLALSRNEFTK